MVNWIWTIFNRNILDYSSQSPWSFFISYYRYWPFYYLAHQLYNSHNCCGVGYLTKTKLFVVCCITGYWHKCAQARQHCRSLLHRHRGVGSVIGCCCAWVSLQKQGWGQAQTGNMYNSEVAHRRHRHHRCHSTCSISHLIVHTMSSCYSVLFNPSAPSCSVVVLH